MAQPKWEREGKLLDQLIRERGYTQIELAHALGVSVDVVGNMCRGVTKIKGPRLRMIAAHLRMTEEEFRERVYALEREPRPDARQQIDLRTINVRGKIIVIPQGSQAIPIYGTVPAGTPGRDFSDAVDVEFMTDWSGPFTRWGCVVSGNSMAPDFLEGDRVIFENRQPNSGQGVYAVRDQEEATFKILRENHGQAELHALNPDYAPTPIEGSDWEVRGVIVRRIRYNPDGTCDIRDYPVSYTFGRTRARP
jgi:SOS-response transcriptional repressor LexA